MSEIIFPVIHQPDKRKHVAAPSNSRPGLVPRETRFDKTVTMKFPVTEEENAQLRNLWLVYREPLKASSITVFLTMLLRFGLRHPDLIRSDIPYQNTKIHKTVKPNQIEKERISGVNGLTVQWQLPSDRKTVHRIIFSVLFYLRRGGTLRHEEVQPIRPY